MKQKRHLSISQIILVIFIMTVLMILTQHFVIEVFKVNGSSMEPALYNEQRVIVTKVFFNVERGDIIVLRSKESCCILLVKRVVGMPGDSYILHGAEKKLQPGEYFVMGDNRLDSYDSRHFGPVSRDDIVGEVVYRWWPISKAGIIE